MVRWAALAMAVAAVWCSTADAQVRENDEVCELHGASSGCAVDDLKPSELDSSVLIFPGGDTRCAFDDFYNESVPFATNSSFFFQVFPNTAGDRSKLFLYFRGGGACIDDITCSFGLQCIVQTFTPNATTMSTGVANRTDPDNMFSDWNLIHIPYCTGDLHVGDHTAEVADDPLLSLLDTPECLGHNMTLHQVGYTNTMAVLDWALANYPDVSQLVIGGSSAGALGAQILSNLVAEKWQVEEKGIEYSILSDSYVGIVPDSHPAGETLKYFGVCDVDLNFPANISDKCADGNLTTVELMSSMLEGVPSADWLFLDTEGDYVQRYYYALVNEGILGYPFTDTLMSTAELYGNMTATLDAYQAVSDKVSTFYAAGEQHTFLMFNDFYHNATDLATGEFLGSVINRWLAANSSIDGTYNSSSSAGGGGSGSGSDNGASRLSVTGWAAVVAIAIISVGLA